jgi:hypothetical protein
MCGCSISAQYDQGWWNSIPGNFNGYSISYTITTIPNDRILTGKTLDPLSGGTRIASARCRWFILEPWTGIGFFMRKPIIILDPDEKQSLELCAMLEKEGYHPIPLSSLSEFAPDLNAESPGALIVNLDRVPLNNRDLMELRSLNRGTCIIGLSSRTFHPELKEALTRYIDVCFAKPVDREELLYWLKAVMDVSARNTTFGRDMSR